MRCWRPWRNRGRPRKFGTQNANAEFRKRHAPTAPVFSILHSHSAFYIPWPRSAVPLRARRPRLTRLSQPQPLRRSRSDQHRSSETLARVIRRRAWRVRDLARRRVPRRRAGVRHDVHPAAPAPRRPRPHAHGADGGVRRPRRHGARAAAAVRREGDDGPLHDARRRAVHAAVRRHPPPHGDAARHLRPIARPRRRRRRRLDRRPRARRFPPATSSPTRSSSAARGRRTSTSSSAAARSSRASQRNGIATAGSRARRRS